MTLRYFCFFLLFFNGILVIDCSKILMVFNHFGRSHYIQGKALGHGLAKAGHDVTMVSPFKEKNIVNGYKEIVTDGLINKLGFNTNLINFTNVSPLILLYTMTFVFKKHVDLTVNHTNFQKLLKSEQKFDVIILEDVYNGALRALSWHFQAPMIIFNPFAPTINVIDLSGTPSPPSYIPSFWIGYTNYMNFFQRSMNTFMAIYERLIINFLVNPAQEEIIKKYFPKCPNLASLNENISLYLLNNHESVNPPIPNVPSIVNILGFHLKNNNELPKFLQDFMDVAKEGVILFSFGTFVNPSAMDQRIKNAFLKSLGKLKQKVLWKTDDETVLGKPDNVYLSKWLPQEDILAHHNCKLFITHAGFVSTIETIYHAVPVLAVPLAGDQPINAARMVELEIGLSTTFLSITEEKLDYLLNELLSNQKYQENVDRRSQLMRDRPLKPMDLATYWVEYVIRNKNLSHMRVAGLDLKWYQYILLDVFLIWSIICATLIFLMYFMSKKIISLCKAKRKIKTI